MALVNSTECIQVPPPVNSHGVLGNDNSLNYSLPLLELQIVLIIVFNLVFHFAFKRLGIPKLVTHSFAGICIGIILKQLRKSQSGVIFSINSQLILGTLAEFGYMLFLFIIGVKMDMKMIKTTGKTALAIGVIALVAPLLLGGALSQSLMKKHFVGAKGEGIRNLAITLSLTTFPVVSTLLNELGIINSELGRLALSSGIISELLSSVLIAIAATIHFSSRPELIAGTGTGIPLANLILLVVFLICAVFIIRPAMFWVIKQTPEGKPVEDKYLMIIISGVLLSAVSSHLFGQFVLFAPYIIGLVTPDGPPLGSALVRKLETFVLGMLMPLFVTTCASRVLLSGINFASADVWGVVALAVLASVGKFLACLVTTVWCCDMPSKDGLALSLIMSAKGIVEIAAYSFMRDAETISEQSFTVAFLSTMVLACSISIMVKRLYDPSRKYAGYQKRNIISLKSMDELRVLVCIHRPDNISTAIKLLEASNPSVENPFAVFVLHLIELVGRTTPIFISHQFQKKTVADHSYSENVIHTFTQYEASNDEEALSVQLFTAISPQKLMHEDIGTLALNKLASLIIMPFHRKWGMDGSIESESHSIRTLNCSLLDRAPCSVGILVDRGRLVQPSSESSSYNVAMIFIGGNDDREAVSYAMRMVSQDTASSEDINIRLTVIRFMEKDGDDEKKRNWDWILDSETLKNIRVRNRMMKDEDDDEDGLGHHGHDSVKYREEIVADGPEMALKVRTMVHDFDLIIVGRRYIDTSPQTSGLSQWSEFPELGIIGDFLSSPDLESRTSVLIVQQQQMAT